MTIHVVESQWGVGSATHGISAASLPRDRCAARRCGWRAAGLLRCSWASGWALDQQEHARVEGAAVAIAGDCDVLRLDVGEGQRKEGKRQRDSLGRSNL